MDVRFAIAAAISQPITVEGILLIGKDSRLVFDDSDPSVDAILLPHDATSSCLLSEVPAYGGGPHIYHENAVVTGSFASNPPRFVTIEEITVIREDERYHFQSVFPKNH